MLGVSGVSVIFGGGLSPDDVGARVSVRHRRSDGVADVIGDLDFVDADGLAIRPSDGSLVVIETGAVVAARVVGPSPRSARELEAVAGRSWPAAEEAWLGRWWLRAAGGFTARANSVRPLGDPGQPFDDALAFAAAWYAERSLPVLLRTVVGSSVDRELDHRGWATQWETSMRIATIASMRRRLIGVPASAVQLTTHPPAAWLRRYRDGTLPPTAVSVLSGGPTIGFATIEGAPRDPAIAIGRVSVEPPWAGLAAIEVRPDARRQGHGRAVLAALVEWATERGAIRCWLEVLTDNAPALAMYDDLGFTEHYRYTYRTPSLMRA
jgi:GNAT superfamily N-acetyltransferase